MLLVSFGMIVGYNVYQSQSYSDTEGMSDMMLENVEALANPEIIRCVSSLDGYTLFYCKRNYMLKCYCDGLKPGEGWEKTNNPN